MSRLKDRSIVAKRKIQFKVHAPRHPSEPEDFARFVAQLNGQFGLIADQLSKMGASSITPDDYVRKDELPTLVNEKSSLDDQTITSEGADSISPSSTDTQTSAPGGQTGDDSADTAIENAIPTSAPPPSAPNSSVGTTISPTLFALSDHTHQGITRGRVLAMPLVTGINRAPGGKPDLAFRRNFLTMARS